MDLSVMNLKYMVWSQASNDAGTPREYKTVFMLNSAESEFSIAH